MQLQVLRVNHNRLLSSEKYLTSQKQHWVPERPACKTLQENYFQAIILAK